jgi:sulfide:quinone oxidoreductase
VAQAVTRIEPESNRLTLADGSALDYDYLVITTGPRLAFDEVPGAGPAGHTRSICSIDHAEQTWADYQRFLEAPGPVVVAPCPGPRASGRPMSSPSSSTATCASAGCATRCP